LKQNNPVFLNAVYRINDATHFFLDGFDLESVDGMSKSKFEIDVEYEAEEDDRSESDMESESDSDSDLELD
jgi:hypothetical protein